MSQTKQQTAAKRTYHPAAYEFVDHALRFAQKKFSGINEGSHITGSQLLDGIRELAIKEFGMMSPVVFRHWGIHSTDDFGRVVWNMIETDRMRKTDRDQLSDFCDVYDFADVFDREYRFNTSQAFRR
jgi:uncharacterized repeat protein (TIGR04138 family)